jgi:hypothetical protein
MTTTTPGANPQRICAFEFCKKPLPTRPGHGRHDYCSLKCWKEARKRRVHNNVQNYYANLSDNERTAYQNARRFFSDRGITRRDYLKGTTLLLFSHFLETRPTGQTAQYECYWRQLRTFQQAVALGQESFAKAGALAQRALLKGDQSLDAFYLRNHFDEIRRDAGQLGDPADNRVIRPILDLGEQIERKWYACGDAFNLAEAWS